MSYKAEWPLNIILTNDCMKDYNQLFSFLLRLKWVAFALADTWRLFKAAKLNYTNVQLLRLQMFR
jgi:gamma-tubulin complex component 6